MKETARATRASQEEVDRFLKGSDPQERIIKIECSYKDARATVIYRDRGGVKHYDKQDFYPFCWAKQDAGRMMFKGNRNMLKMRLQDCGIGVKALTVANPEGGVHQRMADGYRVMFYAERPMSMSSFSKFFDEAGVPLRPREGQAGYGRRLYITVAPAEQFMISTGKRLFKGYESYDDLTRLSFDLETEGLEPEKDAISQIGIRTNKGFEKIITIEGEGEQKKANEMAGVREFFDYVGDIDPDVVTGYNIENFDNNFMDVRANVIEWSSLDEVSKRPSLPNGCYKSKREAILKLGGEVEKYYPTVMWGKHITDCLFSVRRAQADDSNMKKATLKYVTKYSKIAKKNRVYLPGKIINKTWLDTEPHYAFNDDNGHWYSITEDRPLKDGYTVVTGRYIAERYLLDDLWETDKVELRYNESNFLVGKMLPVNFDRMCTMGTATIWKYIMLAWSYEHNLAIPKETDSQAFTGGLSRLLTVGYVPNVLKLDYNSLYPSIILTFGIKTPVDISDAMPAMLDYVLTNREKYKDLKAQYGDEAERIGKEIDALLGKGGFESAVEELMKQQFEAEGLVVKNDKLQLPLKKTGNTYFGAFGSGGTVFYWADMECAEETTCSGRQMLRLMLKWFTDKGYQGIVCDTDGMNFRMPDKFEWTEEHPYVSTGMNRNTVAGNEYVGERGDLAQFNDLFMRKKNGLGIDEMIPSSIYLSRKNYADLLDAKKLKIKLVGNTLKSKKMPIYIEKFIDSAIVNLLQGDGKAYLEKYYDKVEEIYNLKIPLKDIATVGKIKVSLDEYKNNCRQLTKGGTKKARQAWYELAIKHGLDVHMGDSIYYINTGKKKGDSDIQRVTKYYRTVNGEKTDVTRELKKEWEGLKKSMKDPTDLFSAEASDKLTNGGACKPMNLDTYIKTYHKDVRDEDEIVFNCILLPNEVVEDEEDRFCGDDFEYNVEKYVKMFNDRIKAHMVCFDRSVRTKYVTDRNGNVKEESAILITDPRDRRVFTDEQCRLVSGQPFKPEDQDTYEQLMTMEDKEIRFWISVGKKPVYCDECGMDWEAVKVEYLERMEKLKGDGIRDEVAEYERIVSSVTESDINALAEDGVIPEGILAICDFDASAGAFISKKWGLKVGSIYDILDHNFKAVKEPEDDYDAVWGKHGGDGSFLDAIFG